MSHFCHQPAPFGIESIMIGSRLFLMFVAVICVSCVQSTKTFHDKVGMVASDYFEDRGVVKLCRAIQANDLNEIRRLVKEEGVDVNTKGKDNVTPLLWSYLDNQVERFQLLLELGADPNVVLTGDVGSPRVFTKGEAVVHITAGSNFPDHFSLVMQHGGDHALVDNLKETAISRVLRGHAPNMKERVQLLIDQGADLNFFSMYTGNIPLALAIANAKRFDIVLLMLNNGADYEFYFAMGRTNAVMLVITLGEYVDKYGKDLAKQEYQAVVEWLKEHGADFERAQEEKRAWRKESEHMERYTEEYFAAKALELRVKQEAEKRYEELKKKYGQN